MALAGATAVLAPGQGLIAADPIAGPTAESAGVGATAARPCPTGAGILATVLIPIRTAAWGCLV